MGKLSQAIAEGDGISFVVEVADAGGARAAHEGEAAALASRSAASRAASQLPFLHLGNLSDARDASADAVVIEPDLAMWDEARAHGLECVVRLSEPSDLERALRAIDPEVFLLTVARDAADPLTALLELLHDVPAGTLAIAELHDATSHDVAELERSGMDAVLLSPDALDALFRDGPPAA